MNVPAPDELVITEVADQVIMRLFSLAKISRVSKNYFNGNAISTSFALPLLNVVPVTFTLVLNDKKSVITALSA